MFDCSKTHAQSVVFHRTLSEGQEIVSGSKTFSGAHFNSLNSNIPFLGSYHSTWTYWDVQSLFFVYRLMNHVIQSKHFLISYSYTYYCIKKRKWAIKEAKSTEKRPEPTKRPNQKEMVNWILIFYWTLIGQYWKKSLIGVLSYIIAYFRVFKHSEHDGEVKNLYFWPKISIFGRNWDLFNSKFIFRPF